MFRQTVSFALSDLIFALIYRCFTKIVRKRGYFLQFRVTIGWKKKLNILENFVHVARGRKSELAERCESGSYFSPRTYHILYISPLCNQSLGGRARICKWVVKSEIEKISSTPR